MKKVLFASLLSVGLSISAMASVMTPRSASDQIQVPPNYSGVKTCIIDTSTGTAVVQCATGAGIVLDIIASSVAVTDSIILRDSAPVANVSLSNTGIGAGSGFFYVIDKNSLGAAPGTRIYPRFKNGLEANAGVAPTAHLGNTFVPSWIIVYTTDLY